MHCVVLHLVYLFKTQHHKETFRNENKTGEARLCKLLWLPGQRHMQCGTIEHKNNTNTILVGIKLLQKFGFSFAYVNCT